MLAGLLAFAATSCRDNANDDIKNNANSMNQTDRDFMMKASYGNNAETDAGNMAMQKANEEEVRMFGQMMITDHNMAQTELAAVASEKGVNIPQGLDEEHQQAKQQLSTLTGRAFDSTYMAMQVADHRKTITLFEDESANGKDNRVKEYANKYLPKLREHLQMADSIHMMFQ